MKCVSCEVEINPKWRHAIDINVCPFCGSHILEEHLKNLLSALRETMDKLTEYPEQVNDWMLSNFNFIKTDSADLYSYLPKETIQALKKSEDESRFQEKKKYTVKVKTELGEEDIETEKIQSDEKTNDFFKRAEVKLTVDKDQNNSPNKKRFDSVSEKTEHLKNIKKQIEREGSLGITNEAGLAAMIDPSIMEEGADPEAVAEYQALMSGDEIASSLGASANMTSEDDDAIPPIVLAMANMSKGGKSNNSADMIKLQQMQHRKEQSKANFESGENRGGKGGGFSRA